MTAILSRNISLLEKRNMQLARRILSAKPKSGLTWITSRSGSPVPRLDAQGQSVHVHSIYNPENEGRRLHEHTADSRAFIFYGLGCGYTITPFLGKTTEFAFIVDFDIELYRSIFEKIDLTDLLSDPRVHLLIDSTPENAADTLRGKYIPSLYGGLITTSLQTRSAANQKYFSAIGAALAAAHHNTEFDVSTQKRFGRRWAKNIIANVSLLGKRPYPPVNTITPLPDASKTIHVTAAGPSLEDSLPFLKTAAEDDVVVATDTSLPVLLSAGIRPEFVVSIDCQIYSYHHFLRHNIPESSTLILDLSSPPLLWRDSRNVSFISGGHPLSRFLASGWLTLPYIDTSGGNVTHAAVSVADKLCGSEIILHGADFSFPEGKLYARESYLYHFFRSTEKRTSPLSGLFASLLFNRGDITMAETGTDSFRYLSSLMTSYLDNLNSSIPGLRTTLRRVDQAPVDTSSTISPSKIPGSTGDCLPSSPWAEFGLALYERLEKLNIKDTPIQLLLADMSTDDHNLTVSLMPLTPELAGNHSSLAGYELLDHARKLMMDLIGPTLN